MCDDAARSKKSANPFYGLLVVAGIAFALTATAYGVMAFREARPPAERMTRSQPGGASADGMDEPSTAKRRC